MIKKYSSNLIETKLEEVISKKKKSLISGPFGSNIGKRFFQPSGVPVIRGNNLSEGGKKFLDSGFVYLTDEKASKLNCYAIVDDLVFTAVGTIGQVGIIEDSLKYQKYVISNKQLRVRFNTNRIIPLFAYYWFSSSWMNELIKKRNVGSTVPLINLSVIRDLPLLLPESTKTQEKIVDILENIGSKIELNNKINEELEAMAKLIYDYWFVQFDFPISKEQAHAMRKPELEGKPYKSSGGKMVYSKELKREIPEGWGVELLGDFEENIVTGKTPSTKVESNFGGEIPFICIGDIRGKMFVVETDLTLSKEGAYTQKNKFLPKGTICVSCIASPGLVGIVTKPSQTNQQINSIICKRDFNRGYLYFYLTDYFKFAKAKTGNTFANMNKGDFSAIKIVTPEIGLLKKFEENLKSSFDKILNISLENIELIELRDWLLPMLMNGQVTVGEVEEELSKAAEAGVEYEAE